MKSSRLFTILGTVAFLFILVIALIGGWFNTFFFCPSFPDYDQSLIEIADSDHFLGVRHGGNGVSAFGIDLEDLAFGNIQVGSHTDGYVNFTSTDGKTIELLPTAAYVGGVEITLSSDSSTLRVFRESALFVKETSVAELSLNEMKVKRYSVQCSRLGSSQEDLMPFTKKVLVSRESIPSGSELNQLSVGRKRLPKERLPLDALTSIAEYSGKLTVKKLEKDDVVRKAHLK